MRLLIGDDGGPGLFAHPAVDGAGIEVGGRQQLLRFTHDRILPGRFRVRCGARCALRQCAGHTGIDAGGKQQRFFFAPSHQAGKLDAARRVVMVGDIIGGRL